MSSSRAKGLTMVMSNLLFKKKNIYENIVHAFLFWFVYQFQTNSVTRYSAYYLESVRQEPYAQLNQSVYSAVTYPKSGRYFAETQIYWAKSFY